MIEPWLPFQEGGIVEIDKNNHIVTSQGKGIFILLLGMLVLLGLLDGNFDGRGLFALILLTLIVVFR